MLDSGTMKDSCRICARELCGNQRRWIFHPTSKLNLQVLLSHALGRELTRDGRGEFACSKCAFMLDRMYRFDTVIARVEALSLERLHKLLLEKDRLRQCIGGLYRKNNAEDGAAPLVGVVVTEAESEDSHVVDLSALQDVRYSDMVQDDLAYSVYESWADKEDPALDQNLHLQTCPGPDPLSGHKPRRCRGCAALRVADSDYEAVCKVPRSVGRRSTSCGPSTRYSGGPSGSEAAPVTCETDKTLCDLNPSPSSSVESLDTAVDVGCLKDRDDPGPDRGPEEALGPGGVAWSDAPAEGSVSGLGLLLGLLRGWDYQPVKPHRGSRLPVLIKARLDPGLTLPLRPPMGGGADRDPDPLRATPEVVTPCPLQELVDMEEQWTDEYVQCGPFRFQQRVVDEQQSRLSRYEDAAAQCVNELNQAQNQVRSLQNKIRLSETRNQKLQERLGEMELELRSAREEAQQQERNLQNISDTMRSKEDEAAELYRVIEEQNRMLCSLRELTNRSQMQQLQVSGSESLRGQGEVLALQASLFQAQLDLQAGQRAQRQASRTQEDLNRALQRLEKDLQGALQHRRETQRHNQELQMALEKARSDLQEREEQLNEAERERKREEEERETKIREMKTSLDQKDQLIQEYTELMDEPKDKRDGLLVKLRQRIKDRDRALERAVDEKFRCVEEKDEQIRQLQLLLREKDRDVERQRCVLTNNQETISSLEVLVRGKSLELDQVCEAWRNVQQQGAESEEHHRRDLRERDAIISQLQTALHGRTQEAQDLRCSLLTQVQSSPRDVLEELKVRLQLKDRLFQEVLADRTRQAQEHQDQVQDLLRTISSRDQYIQESSGRLGEVMEEQTSRLQELRRQLSSAPGPGPGPGPGSGPGWTVDLDLDLQAVQEELRLALRRNQENQDLIRTQTTRLESMGRSLRAKDDIIRDLQIQTVNPPDLPLVQRLTRELLELKESLAQRYQDQDRPLTRGPVLGLDLDRPSGGGGGGGGRSSDDEDEADEDLNSEFTDEDEASRRRSSVDTKGSGPDGFLEDPGLLEVKQLVEQKRAVERELMELKVQLEKTGFHSLSQIRNALFSLRDENERLKEQLSGDKQRGGGAEEEEEELDVTIEGAEEEEEEGSELWDTWDHEDLDMSERTQMKKTRQIQVDAHLDPPTNRPQSKTVHLQKQRAELEERLMVSEATVQVQAEQLKDYRDLLMESAVQQDSKQIQVDLQDLGYETSGRSENEAEREDTSSPEFDDLEMCTSLDCGSNWWPANGSSS
ncbi:LOW QUALITY PROTEIN: myomegalin-like, partial [Sphaeramia orbicularis]